MVVLVAGTRWLGIKKSRSINADVDSRWHVAYLESLAVMFFHVVCVEVVHVCV